MLPIPGFTAYAVDKCGGVFRVETRVGDPCEPRPLKPYRLKNGYLRVSLRKDNKTHYFLVHRLVAWVYLGDPGPLDVCHWNHKRDDNRVANLYIGTRAENTGQSGREGRYGSWRKGVAPANKKLTDEMRKEIKVKYSTGSYRQVDLAAEYGVCQRSISLVCRA